MKKPTIKEAIATAEPINWPEPIDLLGQHEEAVPAFPITFLPEPFASHVVDAADRLQVPPDFVGIPTIIVAATMIGRHFQMGPKAKDGWTERACLWGAIVAPPASHKTPAFEVALRPLHEFQRELRERHELQEQRHAVEVLRARIETEKWKAEAKKPDSKPDYASKPKEPDPPIMPRVIINEATQEAIAQCMGENPRGLLQYRDELSGWFLTFNQYRQGADRQFFLQAHAGGPYSIDRKTSPSIHINDLYLNIFGGIQTDILPKVLAGGDLDGMSARFSLMVRPERLANFKYVDRPPDPKLRANCDRFMRNLRELEPEDFFSRADRDHAFRFDAAGQKIFTAWYTNNRRRLESDDLGGPLAAHIGKYAGLFARLSLVRHLMTTVTLGDRRSSRIGADTASAVASFIDDYLEPHARRIYGRMGMGEPAIGAERIARWLRSDRTVTAFTARDIRQKDWTGLKSEDEVNRAVDHLEIVASWIKRRPRPATPIGGRSTVEYVVNPKIHAVGANSVSKVSRAPRERNRVGR